MRKSTIGRENKEVRMYLLLSNVYLLMNYSDFLIFVILNLSIRDFDLKII